MLKIPEFKILLKGVSQEAKKLKKFRYADSEIGNRHKVGGEPNNIQDIDWPICACCKNKMSFYAQLDSLNDEFCIGDCGMIYVFICFDCLETKSIIQSF